MNTITACYDLEVSPPTYDFLLFMVEAERHRRSVGADKIDLVIQPGSQDGFRPDGLPPDLTERRSMLARVVVAGARLLPSISDVVCFGQRTNMIAGFPANYYVDQPVSHYGACYWNTAIQCLRATDAARREIKARVPFPYTTITLREAAYWPKRNSNMEAWTLAASWLSDNGHNPIIVPDTHGIPRLGLREYREAAWDIDLRMALYEGSTLNLGVSNGPMYLSALAEKRPPYVMLNIIADDGPASSEEFLKANGIVIGQQFSSNGLTIWEKDSIENVMRVLHGAFGKRAAA